ncbi:MAG TPA: ADP-ribosylglycohydrolase family protein [Lacisediminihabitans sp.]|uniref:ADP-ribosylglycohydrolase family protein n=1 Tax=Lacisediminihabitans sp. TaxID=2787631 RepID=UPI002ED7B000
MHDVLDPRDTVPDEAEQLRLSGYALPAELQSALDTASRAGDGPSLHLLEPRLASEATRVADWPYDEPDDAASIFARMSGTGMPRTRAPEEAELRDRITGAWLGRCVGCCVGKPIEGLTPGQIRQYLAEADAWPLLGYVPLSGRLPDGVEKLNPSWVDATLGNVDGMPRDDDIDYTILGLHVLETYGRSFTRHDIAHEWLDKLPFLQTFTAERIVYRNVVSGIPVDEAAAWRNPYREWIGALIRADVFGYINPGLPEEAARLAFADASLSHTGNGIYGEMWAAALVAEAFVSATAQEAVERSRRWIPRGSRLEEAVDRVIELHAGGGSWEDAIAWIDETFREHSWVHTLNNAAVIVAGLIWGQNDPAKAIGLTVQAGYDTDSSAATVGSVMGAILGAAALPAPLVVPLNDRIRSAVRGYDNSRISELAERTLAMALEGR